MFTDKDDQKDKVGIEDDDFEVAEDVVQAAKRRLGRLE